MTPSHLPRSAPAPKPCMMRRMSSMIGAQIPCPDTNGVVAEDEANSEGRGSHREQHGDHDPLRPV